MSPNVRALYTTLRLVLLAFAFAAAVQGRWGFVAVALLVRAVLWWIALPLRQVRSTGRTLREHMVEDRRRMAREHGFADVALTVARAPTWVGLPCRLIMILPMRLAGDPTTNALLLRGRSAGHSLATLVQSGGDTDRESAARALADLKSEGYSEALRPLLDDPVLSVRAVAEEALGASDASPTSDPYLRLVRLPSGSSIPDDLTDGLRGAWEQLSAGERRVAIRQMGERGGEAAIARLLELLASDCSEAVLATRAVRQLDDPRIADALLVRARHRLGLSAIQELVRRGDARVEPIVVEQVGKQGWTTRGLYIGLLAQLPTESARMEALRLASSERGFGRFLAADAMAYQGGDPEPLRRYARSWNPLTRLYARTSLRRYEARRLNPIPPASPPSP